MVGANEVQALNSRIEKINVQRTKAETRSEMLKKQLEGELSSYESNFGVSLKGQDFTATKIKVELELKKVLAEVEAEYKLKEQVVSSIENGDYDTAYQLLGVEKKSSSVEPKATEMTPIIAPELDLSTIQQPEMSFEMEEDVEEVVEKVPEMSMQVEEDDEEIILPPSKTTVGVAQSGSKSVSKSIQGTSAISAVEEMQVEEDAIPSLEDSDFGFGSILQGTKFSTNE